MTIATIVGQLLLGWLLADLLSGIAHWLEDRVIRETDTWVGRAIIAANRLHHVVSLIWIMTLGVSLTWLSATIAGMGASMAHYWAHDPRAGGSMVRTLQEIGLLQSPIHHAGHHRSPSDRRYCAISNWVNPVLDAVDVWTRAERMLIRVGVPIAAFDA